MMFTKICPQNTSFYVLRRYCSSPAFNIDNRTVKMRRFLKIINNAQLKTNYINQCKFSTLQTVLNTSSNHKIKRSFTAVTGNRNYTIIQDPSFLHSSGEQDDQSKTEDVLYNMFKEPEGHVMAGRFLANIYSFQGLRRRKKKSALHLLTSPEEVHKKVSESLAKNSNTKRPISKEEYMHNSKDCGSLREQGLRATGLRKTDPRLANLIDNLTRVHKEMGGEGSCETAKLDKETFQRVISGNLILISRAFRNHFIIPDFHDLCKNIEEMYWTCKTNTSGKPASYIPQLARANPDHWGVSVCTIDGQRFSIGDVSIPFTLQSCSKPLNYAIALDHLGEDVVHSYVGQEPSGRMFNELILDHNKKPHNPMINAGAIVVCSLLKSLIYPNMTLAEKFDFTKEVFKSLAGGEYIGFNNAVFLSEREAADRNYALGFYMREHKCYPEKSVLKETMDFYFQCCAMESTCDSAAVIAASLANGGICPLTEEKVLGPDSIRNVLSLMHSCGMYDYSGQFAFKVGLPAKSGVSGCLLVVIPNVMGICSWSPPLDPLGNSCRGVQLCQELVRIYNFHRYDNLKHAPKNKKDPRRHKYETKGMNIVNLLFAAASGDLHALRRHHLSGLDMTLSDYDGRTALHLAAAEGHLECVKFLVEQCKVVPSPKDRWGNTPLKEATTFKHEAVTEYLQKILGGSTQDQ